MKSPTNFEKSENYLKYGRNVTFLPFSALDPLKPIEISHPDDVIGVIGPVFSDADWKFETDWKPNFKTGLKIRNYLKAAKFYFWKRDLALILLGALQDSFPWHEIIRSNDCGSKTRTSRRCGRLRMKHLSNRTINSCHMTRTSSHPRKKKNPSLGAHRRLPCWSRYASST